MRFPGSTQLFSRKGSPQHTICPQVDRVNMHVPGAMYLQRQNILTDDTLQVDEEGLPLVYNEQRITEFWRNRCEHGLFLCCFWPGKLHGIQLSFACMQMGRASHKMDHICRNIHTMADPPGHSCSEGPPGTGASAAGQGCCAKLRAPGCYLHQDWPGLVGQACCTQAIAL